MPHLLTAHDTVHEDAIFVFASKYFKTRSSSSVQFYLRGGKRRNVARKANSILWLTLWRVQSAEWSWGICVVAYCVPTRIREIPSSWKQHSITYYFWTGLRVLPDLACYSVTGLCGM